MMRTSGSLKQALKYSVIIVMCMIILTFLIPKDLHFSSALVDNSKMSKFEISINEIVDDLDKEHMHTDVTLTVTPTPSNQQTTLSHSLSTKPVPTSGFVQDNKLFILLVTGFRTGSTFLGELFNQNPQVTYVFEPFHQRTMMSFVEQGFIEDLPRNSTLLEQRTMYLEQITQKCKIGWPMFAGMSKTKNCGSSEENFVRFGVKNCPSKDDRAYDLLCKARKVVALKIIRLQRIEQLELVPGLKNVNFKVIHLIRDPRGTMNSRSGWGSFFLADSEAIKTHPLTPVNMGTAADDLCTREMDNLNYSTRLPAWMKGRYLRVTHDDLSLHPIETAEQVYKFVNMTIPPTLNAWLIEHTTTQTKGLLSTSKDSKAILEKWKSMELDIIRTVEEKCAGVMQFMGYTRYDGPGGETFKTEQEM